MNINSKLIKAIVFLSILFWYGIFFSHKIDLSTADLGRHLKNGEIILNGTSSQKWSVLHTNFYSYTLPKQSFINHHWLSGVIFFLVYTWFGFTGLSILYVSLNLGAVTLFFDTARRSSNFWVSSFLLIILMPLITIRAEIRPEAFTYFLTAVLFWILFNVIQKNRYVKLFWILPFVILLWVNLHIGFIFGFLVLGAFGVKETIYFFQKKTNHLFKLLTISTACIFAALINPFFIKGLLYPFQILNNYGYLIVENQSIPFLENLNFTTGQHFVLFKLVILLIFVSFVWVAFRNLKKIDITLLILIILFGIISFLGIRNFPLFALFAIPVLAVNTNLIIPNSLKTQTRYNIYTFGVMIVMFCLIQSAINYNQIKSLLGLGLIPNIQAATEFYKDKKIQGPIFNNYDIGGYLIFNIYPEKVFVDNRPEAYGADFFKNTYIPMQESQKKWQQIDKTYQFNAIFFSHRDYTPWGQMFLVSKINDNNWAPVFVDNYNIIFLKRNERNSRTIKKYELSKDLFKVTKN